MKTCITAYDKNILIEALTGTTTDAANEVDPTNDANWTTHTPAAASVQSKGGREFWKVDRVDATVSHVWRCPYSAKLATADPDMRLKHNGAIYFIMAVVDINLAHEVIEIQTRAGA